MNPWLCNKCPQKHIWQGADQCRARRVELIKEGNDLPDDQLKIVSMNVDVYLEKARIWHPLFKVPAICPYSLEHAVQ